MLELELLSTLEATVATLAEVTLLFAIRYTSFYRFTRRV
nr:MAG TPA: hypothetical protein [Caudoviricetes sp.]